MWEDCVLGKYIYVRVILCYIYNFDRLEYFFIKVGILGKDIVDFKILGE